MTEQHSRLPPDNGCGLHPRCLECPRLRCRYDEVDDGRTMVQVKMFKRNDRIRTLRREGAPVSRLIKRFRLTNRTIYRILNEERR